MGGLERLKKYLNAKERKEVKEEPKTASSPVDNPRPSKLPDKITDPQPPLAGNESKKESKQNKLQEQLWNEAYDKLRESGNKYIAQYEEILVSELKKDNPDTDSASLGSSHEERWRHMQRLVQIGLSKTEKEAKIYEKVNDGLELFGTVRALVEPAVSAVPQAAIPWVGVCFILEVISNPAKQPGIHREGLQHVLSRVNWYWNLAELLLEDNLESKEDVEGRR
ncbi:hypothetical protein FOMG_14004 [Fusarium oxysporum f. sp. melonis 26406]|uniref:NWD NACHT-NTPase N-terminal domain-containing protein n=1 Tax=Fusarium oxysporum f. sp. melonis 26406 TaxID=1089452 RepID=W9ZDV8_FUSOX|nr:hypothetical protein FOMG_14004 [Fusarium oxysporum f. sp. melonis 26406]